MSSAQQVVIIGAPRSGTNMLRDLLCSVDGVATWPCDEINYIWRHGNARHPSDAFTMDMAQPRTKTYINRQFQRLAKRYDAHTVVEKTCANSLRVGFVDRILDAPKFIFIFRNGFDATASAMERWRASFEPAYTLRKVRFVPISDLPYYALRYLGHRLRRLSSRDQALSSWGPVLPDMQHVRATHTLAEICALQWQGCVEMASTAFESIDERRILRVQYEQLVTEKQASARSMAEFLEIDPQELGESPYLGKICADSVGKGQLRLTADQLSRVSEIISPTLRKMGY